MAEFTAYRNSARQKTAQEYQPAYSLPSLPSDPVPGMSYVPVQNDISVYDESRALERGTVFPCLDKPFAGKRCR